MLKIMIAIVVAALASPALAMNINVLKDAPVSRLNADEVKAFQAAVMKGLEENADGTMLEWKAPKTQFTSRVTYLKTYTADGMKCRDATIDSEAKDRQAKGTYTLCKGPKGAWGFHVPKSKPKAGNP